eukprot:gene17458-20831_t
MYGLKEVLPKLERLHLAMFYFNAISPDSKPYDEEDEDDGMPRLLEIQYPRQEAEDEPMMGRFVSVRKREFAIYIHSDPSIINLFKHFDQPPFGQKVELITFLGEGGEMTVVQFPVGLFFEEFSSLGFLIGQDSINLEYYTMYLNLPVTISQIYLSTSGKQERTKKEGLLGVSFLNSQFFYVQQVQDNSKELGYLVLKSLQEKYLLKTPTTHLIDMDTFQGYTWSDKDGSKVRQAYSDGLPQGHPYTTI